MTITTIDEIGRHVAADVEVRGWVYNLRSSGAIHFLLLRDGTGILQAVAARQDLPAEVFEAIGALTQESSVIAGGIVREDRRGLNNARSFHSLLHRRHAGGTPL